MTNQPNPDGGVEMTDAEYATFRSETTRVEIETVDDLREGDLVVAMPTPFSAPIVERAVPPEPEVEPGTAGTATVRGVEGVRVMRCVRGNPQGDRWVSATVIRDEAGNPWTYHLDTDLADFATEEKS